MNRAIAAIIAVGLLAGVGSARAAIETDLVSQGGFENIIGPEPNVGQSPWFAVEGDNFGVVSDSRNHTPGGAVSVALKYYGVDILAIGQNLGVTVEAGKDYEVDLWHAISNPSSNMSHTNDVSFEVSIWTSATEGGTYTKVANRTDIPSTGGVGTFFNYIEAFDASELAGVVGEYMQVRIRKDGFPAVSHRLIVDDVAFGLQLPAEPVLLNPADALVLVFGDASSVITGEVAVSYDENVTSTNVTLTSVSVVDQSHPGGFANVTSLPLTLNDPAPASESVWIEFDNTTAGLARNETATGMVEIVWNEVGSATSATSTVPVNATYLGASEENILFAFNDETQGFRTDGNGDGEADIAFPGVDTSISGLQFSNNQGGSSDTSYGTALGLARIDGGCGNINAGYAPTIISVTNNTGSPMELDSFHFDTSTKWHDGSADQVMVTLTGDLGTFVLTNHTGLSSVNSGNGQTDWPDVDIDLTGLGDRSLADGEVITFTFDWTLSGVGMIDNIALLGTGLRPAILSRVGDTVQWESFGVSGLDTTVSHPVDLLYVAGDLDTNVVITGVTISNTTHAGAMGHSGAFPVVLATPEITNSGVFSLVFDNTVANLAPGEYAEALVMVEWDEPGRGSSVLEFYAYGTRPADVPTNGIIALWETEFLTPDAAYNGVLGRWAGGSGIESTSNKGSLDGSYGSLPAPPATTNSATTWRFEGVNPVATLTVTNKTVAAIELTGFHFDIGRWWAGINDFTLSVSGDVTPDPALLITNTSELGGGGNDFDDHDIDLTGLADHTLDAGESVTFTLTLDPVDPGAEFVGVWIDNIALLGTVDAYGGWADSEGLTDSVNDGPGDNPDGDSKDNLMEYATGGDPLVADGGAGGAWPAVEGGTNWVYFVHQERQDDPSLDYSVTARDDLMALPDWSAAGVQWVGESTGPGVFKSVTNRTDAGAMEFIRLGVEQN